MGEFFEQVSEALSSVDKSTKQTGMCASVWCCELVEQASKASL